MENVEKGGERGEREKGREIFKDIGKDNGRWMEKEESVDRRNCNAPHRGEMVRSIPPPPPMFCLVRSF